MKRILFYTPFITVGGGLQKVLIDYLEGLSDKDYRIDVICDFNMGKDTKTFEDRIPTTMNFKYIKSEKVSKLIYYFRTLGKKFKLFNIILYSLMIVFDFYYYHTKVKKIVIEGNYDFTISFYQFLPAYLTKIKSSKHIIWLHGSVEHFFGGIKNLLKSKYEKKLNKYNYVVTIADEMKEQLINFYPSLPKDKIKRIYNPFNFSEILSKSNDSSSLNYDEKKLLEDKYICTVSRLDEEQKDITTLINAYEVLYKKEKISQKLYIIGDGSSKNDLIKLVNQKKLENKIIFIGNKLNPFVWMKNAELFVLSSKFEGFGLVLVEAIACGTLAISSNCKTGPTEILKNGECGDLFEIGNTIELSEKIEYALNNEDYMKIKSAKARERINEFNKDKIIEQVKDLLS